MQAFTLTVQDDRPPVVDINNVPTVAVPNQLYRYDISAYDPNSTTLTYQLDDNSLALEMTVDALGRLSWTPTETQVGTHPIAIEVIDELGPTTTQTFNLTVSGDTEAPQVNLIPSNVFVADGNFEMPLGDEVTFFTNATDNIGTDSNG